MSYKYAVDTEHRILSIAFNGDVHGEDLLEAVVVMVQLDSQYPDYRHVWDGLEIRMLDVDYKDLLKLVAYIKEEMLPVMKNCPGTAVFVRRHVDYLLIKTIHLMVGAPQPFVVLRDPEALKAWIEQAA
ncbi:MAG: hypothetical protein R2834_18545 [Rhodothermales bacterium]